jgi:exopolysaccharide biosynthesis polyprenyl glycosylphosphotransferase
MAVGLNFQSWAQTQPPRARALTGRRRFRVPARPEMAVVAFADFAALAAFVMIVAPLATTWWSYVFVGSVVFLLTATGHYRSRITLNIAREARSIAACTAVPLLVLAALHIPRVSNDGLIVAGLTVVVSMLILRCALYALIRRLRAKGVYGERTLIIGAGQIGTTFAATLEEHREYGLRPIGFLDDVDGADLPLPLFGGVALLRMVLFEERVDRVVVAFGRAREADMVDVLRACEDASVDIHILPRFFELGSAVHAKDTDDVWGFPLVRLRRPVRRTISRLAKRALDIAVAGTGLIVLSPLYALLALAVKLSSPGPVHFRQQRVGQRGETVEILKFRSMRVHSDSDTEWTIAEETITKVGHVLRVLGLDEIPQLWNILRGQMSLVGPRPERPFFVEQFKAEIPHYDDRHRVPVGLTGLAQVHGLRGDTSIEERARFDNHYIENWSLWRDLTILMQTLFAVVRNVGSAGTSAPVATTVTAGSTVGVVSSGSTAGADSLSAAGTAVGSVTEMANGSSVGAVRSENLEHRHHEDGLRHMPAVHESNEAAPIG